MMNRTYLSYASDLMMGLPIGAYLSLPFLFTLSVPALSNRCSQCRIFPRLTGAHLVKVRPLIEPLEVVFL